MESQFSTLTKLYWRKIFSQAKYWPHCISFLCFAYVVIFNKEEFSNTILYYSEILCFMVMAYAVMFVIQHCNEEDETKWLIKFRSLPVNYFKDYLTAFFGFMLYGSSVILFIFILGCVSVIVFKNSNISNHLKQERIVTASIKSLDRQYEIELQEEIGPNEVLAMKCYFVYGKDRLSPFSVLKTQMSYGENFSQKKDIVLKAKRITNFEISEKLIRIDNQISVNNVIHKLGINNMIVIQKDRPFIHAYINSFFHILVQLSLLILLTLVLGRKFSMEVVLICLMSIFCIQYLVQAMGVEVINDFIRRMENFEHDSQNFQTLWWEKILMTWAVNLAGIEKVLATNYFQSSFVTMKNGYWVASPLEYKSLKSYIFVAAFILLAVPIMKKKEI